ncbi:hypothetical protein OH687_33930 [Burkholderia anthina]|nr:hypothetical protein OH687_33930 [Burkholderia anthina]
MVDRWRPAAAIPPGGRPACAVASVGARGRSDAVRSVSRRGARRTEIRLNFLERRGAASGIAALQKN